MGNLIKETPYSEITATVEVLDRLGLTREHLTRLRRESDYAKRCVKFMLGGGVKGSLSHKHVRSILGKNFWGVEEWSEHFGEGLSKRQLRKIAHFPWSEDFLNSPCPFVKGKAVKETHFAFLGLERRKGKPLTVRRWMPIYSALYDVSENTQEEYATKETCHFRWYLMPIEPVLIGEGKYETQKKMLPAEYRVASPVEEVTKLIFYWSLNLVYPGTEGRYEKRGWCNSIILPVPTYHNRIKVGYTIGGILQISHGWDDKNLAGHGLAVTLRLP